MIAETSFSVEACGRYSGNWRVPTLGVGVVVGAGVGEQGGDGAGSVFGEAGPDGDLMVLLVIEGLDAERVDEGCLDPFGRAGQEAGGGGQFVEQGQVVVLGGGGGVQGGELGLGVAAFGVPFGVAFADAGAVGLGGGVGGVGGLFQFGDEGAFGDLDAGQFGASGPLAGLG